MADKKIDPTGDLANGEYIKTEWKDLDLITDGRMNKIEEAIGYLVENQLSEADIDLKIENVIAGEFDLSSYAKKEDLDDKADVDHEHDNYASKVYVSEKIAEAQLESDDIDLSAYATKEDLQEAIDEIELIPGPQGIQGPKGDKGDQGEKGEDGLTTSIIVNGSTYNHTDGVITLPNYPDTSSFITGSGVIRIEVVDELPDNQENGVLYIVK